MVVITRRRPGITVSDLQFTSPRSPTMIYPPNHMRVAQAMRAAGGWTQISRLNGLQGRGLGAITDNIPSWVLWGAAGLAAGGVVGYVWFRRRKKK